MIDRTKIEWYPLNCFLSEYKELNTNGQYRPVAVGRYGIRTRESIYSKELAKDYSKNKLIYKGTLTVGMGSVQMDIGILSDDAVYSVSPAYHTYRITGVDCDYLRYCLQYRNMDMFTRYMKRGSRQGKSIDLSRWIAYEIPVYSAESQTEIVERLDSVQRIIDARQQQLSALDDLIKARFVEMFGEITDYVNITEIAHTYIGLVTTMTTHYCDKGTPLLFNSSIKADRIVWDGTCLDSEFSELNKDRMHQTYDILTVHTGDIGTSAVIGEELNKSLGFATIVTRINERNKYNPRYISSFLNYGSGKEQLSKYSRDVRNNLNLKDFNRLMVPNASISAQNEYDEFVKQVDKSKSVIQKSLDETQRLFDSLMQEYFG